VKRRARPLAARAEVALPLRSVGTSRDNPQTVSYSTITLEAIGLESWGQLYAKDPAEVIRLMGEKNVPLHPGDAFLAVLVVRSVADLAAASERLESLTRRLELLTWALAILGVLTFAVAVIALFK